MLQTLQPWVLPLMMASRNQLLSSFLTSAKEELTCDQSESSNYVLPQPTPNVGVEVWLKLGMWFRKETNTTVSEVKCDRK